MCALGEPVQLSLDLGQVAGDCVEIGLGIHVVEATGAAHLDAEKIAYCHD